jgi:STELLO glycosyltransferases
MYVVITTIAEPTDCVLKMHAKIRKFGGKLVVAGDRKGPKQYSLDNTELLSIDTQNSSSFKLARLLPEGHYSRKNIGYLQAISHGAKCIYETDDDNAPLDHWTMRSEVVSGLQKISQSVGGADQWVNVYRYFTEENIWPRGLPLDEINNSFTAVNPIDKPLQAPIQQGLVNNSPDVDAIWRLVLDRNFEFKNRPSVFLEPGVWCPFNTQSTWWWPSAFAFLYIPSFCSFRMCDIWKSFVAQRCLWASGYGLVFHAPEVYQDRNEHSLMKDFLDEISGYTGNKKFAQALSILKLKNGKGNEFSNLLSCYEALIKAGFFPQKELKLVNAWISDLDKLTTQLSG